MEKWSDKFGRFFNSKRETIRVNLLHTLFNDGKNPGCMASCSHLSNAGAANLWTGLMVLCYAATDGACAAGLPALAAGGADLLVTSEYLDKVKSICTEGVCGSR